MSHDPPRLDVDTRADYRQANVVSALILSARARSVVMVAAASPGSLGDEPMLGALAQELRDNGVTSICTAIWNPDDRWRVEPVAPEYIQLPGKSIGSWQRFIRVRLDSH